MDKFKPKSTFSLLNIDHVQLDKNWNYRNVISPFYRLYLVEDGLGKLSGLTGHQRMEKGYLYLIPSFTVCNYYCEEYLSMYYLHIIEESPAGHSLFASCRRVLKIPATAADDQYLRHILHLNPNRGLRRSDDPKVYEKSAYIESFRDLNNLSPLHVLLETEGIILQMLSRFLNSDDFQPEQERNTPLKILEVVNYIQSNLQLCLTVAHLAGRVNLHPDYFSRLFHEYTGERPLPYVQGKRIERAQFLLVTADLSIAGIAAETGFESVSYFSRTFKKLSGQTPGEYKRHNMLI
ncbi:MAG: AraC family transcriptional regulator [Bacteroidota bacterium]|nr:AraC family transcriptional regulator [Bacteroidota bacterium]